MSDEENFEAGCNRGGIFGISFVAEWGTTIDWDNGVELGVGKDIAIT